MTQMIKLSIALSLLFLVSCSSVRKAPVSEDTKAKQFSLADKKKAGLYVYRDEILGGGIKMNIFVNGKLFGATQYETFLYKELEPGAYTIRGEAENTSEVQVRLKPGKLYYVWQEAKMGILTARNKMHIVDENTGRSGVTKSERVVVEENNFSK